jgi:hypothetical protein
MTTRRKIRRIFVWIAAATALVAAVPRASAQMHVIEVTADRDSRYKIAGQRTPEITVKAGEKLLLRVTANKGKPGTATVRFMASPCSEPRIEPG